MHFNNGKEEDYGVVEIVNLQFVSLINTCSYLSVSHWLYSTQFNKLLDPFTSRGKIWG